MNIRNSIQEILQNSEIIQRSISNKHLGIIEAYHEISSGKVIFGNFNL
jgi:carbonic anhydrase